ncbi:hypothetical protein Anas_01919 [Armadillidium nasatum]|uniref:Uncharacterized protein n=1 Tax=Armadillidium nasatum TaxID=96803 RepID=A0A5N5TM07_9CRUS|nr:hypothetical protein Anas_01919 [Armadillidium nasatum]
MEDGLQEEVGEGKALIEYLLKSDGSSNGRSRSHAAFQRVNRGDSRSQKPGRGPQGLGLPKHHKSASSLIEGNSLFNGTSRGPSPAPPSSTKSSPGPRTPITPQRSSKSNSKKPPPPTPKKSNFLSVDERVAVEVEAAEVAEAAGARVGVRVDLQVQRSKEEEEEEEEELKYNN